MENKINNIERNKALCERYPYLIPRNVWTDEIPEDYDYSYIRGESELPDGWVTLFLQMCEDIRQPLIEANCLNTFRFSQIKEKYGSMRCYNFGAPQNVQDIIDKYCYLSTLICVKCGRPAKYETQGWVEELCAEHFEDRIKKYNLKENEDYVKINIPEVPTHRYEIFSLRRRCRVAVSCKDEWDRYLEKIYKENRDERP